MSTLNLYRSSAGSGKTHTLVSTYLQLALETPERFQEILAVTFTNQATQEMKQRILSYLHSLAQGLASPIAQELMRLKGWEISILQERAQAVLSKILHHYTHFTVSTIDSFFQSIIRSFAKELGLQSSFSIEIEQEAVLDLIINELVATASHNKQLKQWMVAFAEYKLLDGKTWDFKRELKALGHEIFTEAFSIQEAQIMRAISDKTSLNTFLQKLQQTIVHFERNLQELGEAAMKAIHQASLAVADFAYGKRGVAGYLEGLQQKYSFVPTQRAIGALQRIEAWYSKTTDKQQRIVKVVQHSLLSILEQAIRFYRAHHRTYHTALAVQHFIYAFGTTTQLLERLNDYRDQNNVMLVSDAATFLRQIIAENDAPFVYEKIGAYYKHFLIDEFQDISGLQWQNFQPLINNSLAAGYMSLVVGDAKQSIYRWRGGNWRFLLTQLEEDITRTTAISLSHNWRSKRPIIDFNNTFFTEASIWLVRHLQEEIEGLEDGVLKQALAALAQQLGTAYQDVYQHIPHSCVQDDQGYVNITLLADEQTESGQMLSWREKVKARLPLLIETLQRDGFALKDIALLVRNNAEGRELLQTLLAYQQSAQAQPGYRYDAISAESLYLGHSPWVNILVNALKCLADEQDCLAQAELSYLYQLHVCQEAHPLLHNDLAATREEGYKQHSLLPQAFLAERTHLKQLPLYECIEALISIFQLQRAEVAPFIQAFQDEVLAYSQKKTTDSHHFLAWWKERGHKRSIPRVEGQDAISIMTIHQAKGLQFRAVILPFCEWDFDHNAQKPPIIWCATPTPPFSTFPALPLRYTRGLKDTIYVRDYYEERMQAYLDSLNLLYVAFTRPEDRLYAFAKRPNKEIFKTTADLLYHIFEQGQQQLDHDLANSKAYLIWKEHWNPSANTLEVGKATPIASSSSKATSVDTHPYLTSGWRDRLIIQPNHTLMLGGTTLGVGQAKQSELVRYILARLQKETQLQEALAALQAAQSLSQAEVDNLAQHIEELWRNPTIKAWYDGTWAVKHDTSIISPRGKVYQPDRIMTQGGAAIVVCFITDPSQTQSYEQIQATATLLREMGYSHVQAYLLNLEGKLSIETIVELDSGDIHRK